MVTVSIIIFAVFFAIAAGALLVAGRQQTRLQKQKIVHSLGTADVTKAPETTVLFEAEKGRSGLAVFLARFNIVKKLETQIHQAGMAISPATVGMQCVMAAIPGGLIGFRYAFLVSPLLTATATALATGSAPILYIKRKRARRLAAFESQLPEALDFLARAMRAGHAFSIALEMLAQESEDPLATEFRRTAHEHNLGSPIEVVLLGLSERVPLLDVRFFVSAVLLQRETGGNLAEILNGLAYVIRERFKLKGQIRSASAHARLTASILTFLPLVAALLFSILSPGYLNTLAEHPIGRMLLSGAIVGQVLGHFAIQKLLQIRV